MLGSQKILERGLQDGRKEGRKIKLKRREDTGKRTIKGTDDEAEYER